MSSDESIRTPSPGRDYSSLLNESIEESEEEGFHSEAAYLKAQLDLLSSQKQMHIDMHAEHSSSAQKKKEELEQCLLEERRKFQKDLESITQELLEVKANFNSLTTRKNQEAEALQSKLKAQEEYFLKVIHEKDSTINQLQQKLALNKSEKPKENPKEHIQGISKLIVTLEKEQAELKQKIKDGNDRNSKKLWSLVTRNEKRLAEARGIQEELIKSTILGNSTQIDLLSLSNL